VLSGNAINVEIRGVTLFFFSLFSMLFEAVVTPAPPRLFSQIDLNNYYNPGTIPGQDQ